MCPSHRPPSCGLHFTRFILRTSRLCRGAGGTEAPWSCGRQWAGSAVPSLPSPPAATGARLAGRKEAGPRVGLTSSGLATPVPSSGPWRRPVPGLSGAAILGARAEALGAPYKAPSGGCCLTRGPPAPPPRPRPAAGPGAQAPALSHFSVGPVPPCLMMLSLQFDEPPASRPWGPGREAGVRAGFPHPYMMKLLGLAASPWLGAQLREPVIPAYF